MKPGYGDQLLAEGDPEVAEQEEELIEAFRRQLDRGMWAAVPTRESGRREAVMVRDFSEVAANRGREWSADVDFQVGDVLTWDPPGRFDLIVIAYLHLVAPEMELVLSRSRAWLNPGGEMSLVGHDLSNLEDGHGGPPIPEILWEVDSLLGWLDGMEIIEAQVVRRPVATETGTVYARDALVRARESGKTEPA